MDENESLQAKSSYASSNSNSDDQVGSSSSTDEEQIVKKRSRKRKLVHDHNVEDDRSSSSDHEKSDAAEDLVNNSSSESESSSMEEISVKTQIRRRPKITKHSSGMNFDTENGRTARKFMINTEFDEQDEPCFTEDSQHNPDYSDDGNGEGSVVHADEPQVESDKLTGKFICKSNNLFAENLVIRFSLNFACNKLVTILTS